MEPLRLDHLVLTDSWMADKFAGPHSPPRANLRFIQDQQRQRHQYHQYLLQQQQQQLLRQQLEQQHQQLQQLLTYQHQLHQQRQRRQQTQLEQSEHILHQRQQPESGEEGQDATYSTCNPTFSNFTDLTILGDRFLFFSPAEGSALYRCVDSHTGHHLIAKILTPGEKNCEALLQAQMLMAGSGIASTVAGYVYTASTRKRYLLLEGHHGDLHAYVRVRRKIREYEARRLFKQVAMAVAICHEHGVVLRDLKLRKFVFADVDKTKLRLESLEDAVLVDSENDHLSDRRGCPAYVAPEVLRSGRTYSGKAADIWSLGVLLYTMLVGRYPFNDAEHASLFVKISRGHFTIPESLSSRARCLVKALLRREPGERPVANDVLRHPWLTKPDRFRTSNNQDQCVPEMTLRR